MNRTKEIQSLHNSGYVILRAQRSNNAPIGWKRKDGSWGYVEEMSDQHLIKYKSSFDAELTSKSHCGFYLGFNGLCCIDLDVKKTEREIVDALVKKIIVALGKHIFIETTKSNGYHIYFRYKTDLPNYPDWTALRQANWIEIYHRKRFIASYLSNSKKYKEYHGTIQSLKHLSEKQYTTLLKFFQPWRGKQPKVRKSKPVKIDADTLKRCTSYVEQIEAKKFDITGDNPRWFRIGKAFASAFGSEGFTLFNRVSRFSPKYNEDTIQQDYENFVNGDKRERGVKISIATFFHLCEEAGLETLEAKQAALMHPASTEKEFTLVLTKKEKMAEHVHTLAEEFKRNIFICCTDRVNFYVFDTTHWVLKNKTEVLNIVDNFIDRSEVDAQFRSILRTVPYRNMLLEELYLTTQRNNLEPHTGDLTEGIYINMENGILHINLQSGRRKLLDHEAKYNFTSLLPYSYDPAAQCPKFNAWLDKQMPSKDNQQAYFAFVASCLTKHKADIIMMLVGDTSTGKSSLIEITRRLIGLDNSVPISASTLFSGKQEASAVVMQMENKLLAYDFDAQPFKHLELLLKAAAGEPLPGWLMNVTRRAVSNYARILLAMNPQNYSVFNPAVARRLITIEMNTKVVKDNRVMPAIYEHELAGIFNRIVNEGVKHLIDNNGTIHVTSVMRDATVKFHTQARDSVRWFNALYALPISSDRKDNRQTRAEKLREANNQPLVLKSISDLYAEFRHWLEDNEGYHISRIPLRKHFASDLELIGVKETVMKVQGQAYRGLYLMKK